MNMHPHHALIRKLIQKIREQGKEIDFLRKDVIEELSAETLKMWIRRLPCGTCKMLSELK